jgi:hypothetical protein
MARTRVGDTLTTVSISSGHPRRARSLVIIASVGALFAVGCGSAAGGRTAGDATTRTTARSTATGVAHTGAEASTGGSVHLTDYAVDDGPTSTVIVTGAVGDYGTARSVNPDGTANAEHTGELLLALTRGSFRLGIADLDKRFVAAVNQLTLAAGTCSGTVAVTGTAPVVPGSGTGT